MKLSGQTFCTPLGSGIEGERALRLAREIADGLARRDLELACVVGGGNFLRGEKMVQQGIDRVTADNMGMLATIMNALALQSALEGLGVPTRVLSAIHVNEVAEPFIQRRAVRHLEKGRVVILAAGTGQPYFTTDTTAALRALQVGAKLFLKGTRVAGVYSGDPEDPKAGELQFFRQLKFREILERGLKFMDATAATLCLQHGLPVRVFNAMEAGNVRKALLGEELGTLVE